jgi:hypothetical protein
MNIEDISKEINISTTYLTKMASNCNKLYNTYHILKRNGGKRIIDCPNQELKGLQKWINYSILSKISLPNCIHGFRYKHSIGTNAFPHLGKRYVFCLDLKDFFPSIKFSHVKNLFISLNYDEYTSILLSRLCTFKEYLPQGAVTSPSISNIIFSEIDKNIMLICGTKRVTYTRYADDLTFSCNNKETLLSVVDNVKSIIDNSIFTINEKKSRLMSGRGATIVTGIRLNSKRLSIGNKRKKYLRAKLFDIFINENIKIENSVLGEIAFLRSIEPQTYETIKKYTKQLQLKKEKFQSKGKAN